jgi:hypothetical protein
VNFYRGTRPWIPEDRYTNLIGSSLHEMYVLLDEGYGFREFTIKTYEQIIWINSEVVTKHNIVRLRSKATEVFFSKETTEKIFYLI